jgi:Ca-activated chloride channel family protein
MRRPRLILPTAVLSFVTASTAAPAQAPFQSSVDLVALDVCAMDRQGRPAAMSADDLAVFDNGMQQQVVLFVEGAQVPLAVTLLVDSSRSMHGGLLDRARAAAIALIRELAADSLVEVISFNDHPAIQYPLGADHQRAEASLAGVSPVGGTALYEAVLVAIRNQERASRHRTGSHREVIVLLTDGENTAGHLEFADVLDAARRSGILVYTVVLPPHDAPASGPPWQMIQLAVDTGGKTVAARHADDLTSIYERIAADVRNLYRVGYVPTPLVRDGAWHQIQVRPVAKEISLRTRSGYYAPYP